MTSSPPLFPNLIDGKATAATIRTEVKDSIIHHSSSSHSFRPPKLAVVLVGDRKDSSTYVGMKEKACKECGIESLAIHLPASSSQADVASAVTKLNRDQTVDGILVQLPLPSHMSEKEILLLIDWTKDVDGLHPLNVGNLALRDHTPMFKPCTAEGAVELCRRYGVRMAGAEVVVLGRSNIVGLPAGLLFQQENATVTTCHSRTVDIAQHVRRADILVAAIGKPNFVKADWLKPGCVVIDVGINAVDDSSSSKGYKLVGDVDFANCQSKCKLITPVPGGVGPMTVAQLMKNTLEARLQGMRVEAAMGNMREEMEDGCGVETTAGGVCVTAAN